MSQARALSSDEVRGLREDLTAGTTPTVWFTSAAVGVPEGRSGKVIALDDPAEGDFIQVRPAGSKDVLSFSAGEVTLVKPPRKRKEPDPAAAKTTQATTRTKASAAKSSVPANKPASTVKSAGTGESQTSAPKSGGSKTGDSQTGAADPGATSSGATTSGTKSGGAKTSSNTSTSSNASTTAARRKPRQPSGATVTLSADQTGQWNVEVLTGKKRVLRPTPVTASAVAQAAKTLHDDVAEAVEPLLEAAREQQRHRVEQLQRELEDAQRTLDDLTE